MPVNGGNGAIDAAVRRLAAAYESAGFPPIRPPQDIAPVLAEIEEAVAPLRLPPELVRLWQIVDPYTVTVAPYPHPIPAAQALRFWQMQRDYSGVTPRLLFPMAYESHQSLYVELAGRRGSGGALVENGVGDLSFTVRLPSVAAYLELLATMIELGEFARHQRAERSWIEFDPHGRWNDAQAVKLAGAQPLPLLGSIVEVNWSARLWPRHWLLADGVTEDDLIPRGASATIADLLRRSEGGRHATGTVRARATRIAGGGGGLRVTIEDGTAALDMWCPAAVTILGPVFEEEFEFDVLVTPRAAPPTDLAKDHRDLLAAASVTDVERAHDAASNLYAAAFGTPAAAEATAIRPIA